MVRNYARAAGPSNWVTVVRDANYTIAIDSSLIQHEYWWYAGTRFDIYRVWYRTDHAKPRLHDDKSFNREVVHSLVRCDSLWYKVMSVDMSMGNEPPVVQQRTSDRDLGEQPWQVVLRGTSEE